MAKVTYKPGPGDPASVTWGGKTFEANKSQTVEDPRMIQKAQGNRYFEVSGVTKEEQRQAEVVGGYKDANTGDDIALVRVPRTGYNFGAAAADTRPATPSTATQGSTAIEASRPITGATSTAFEETYGAPQDEFASGESEVSAEYVGPEGTEGVTAKRGRPAGKK
jgi:hypothetical protein